MNVIKPEYCINPFHYQRVPNKEVKIGMTPLGGTNPIRIQSMTNTNTSDVDSTVKQVIELYEAGSEYVRITVPSINDAEHLKSIKKRLTRERVNVPIIADVHYNPLVAEKVAAFVEKVRINPGNYAEPVNQKPVNWNDTLWSLAIERIEEKLYPLIRICKTEGTAIRIGSNHGSLSPRILDRYGDTPYGMTEAVMEYIHIFMKHSFDQLVLSMKSSNVRVMVQAYRLIVNRMMEKGYAFPLHLGVTEAGNGTEGRVKSAIGIGAVLEDGLGDTIRVSLTENPVNEIPVAQKIIERYKLKTIDEVKSQNQYTTPYNPFQYQRRITKPVLNTGSNNPPIVIANNAGEIYAGNAPDFITVKNSSAKIVALKNNSGNQFLLTDSLDNIDTSDKETALIVQKNSINNPKLIKTLQENENIILFFEADKSDHPGEIRKLISQLKKYNLNHPIVLHIKVNDNETDDMINSSILAGSLLTDGLIDGLWITDKKTNSYSELSFLILQASRARISTTEFISCPSCGRTRFDIEKAVENIKAKTGHLKGLKIAIMGCVVNGPGEMADADYGYVGSGSGKVNLYKEKEVIMKNLNEEVAVDELINLIKKSGDWKKPS